MGIRHSAALGCGEVDMSGAESVLPAISAAQWRELSAVGVPDDIQQMPGDRGMSADLFRVRWREASAVLKISRNPRRGAREGEALRHLEGTSDAPRLLGALFESDRTLVLLEDLGGCEPGDILVGVSAERALEVTRLLGRIHGSRWGGPVVAGWAVGPPVWKTTTADDVEGFLAQYSHAWGPNLRKLPAMRDRFAPMLADVPVTLTHADAHLDNFMFRPDPILIDWETARYAPGVIDLVRFLMEGVHSGVRRSIHHDLTEEWRRAVPGVSHGRLAEWLQAACWYSLNAMVPHHATVDLDALPPRMRRVHVHCAQQALDLAADLC